VSAGETHTVQRVIVTRDDHDFVDLSIAPLSSSVAGPRASAGITTTAHHPFYDRTQAAFVDAANLRVGDVIQTPTGSAVITNVRAYHGSGITYDLTINGLHTYYVIAGNTPVLVHNCDGPTLNLKYKDSWTADQRAAADAKVAALNSADHLTVTEVERSGSAADVWRANGRDTVPGSDIDHQIDLQLGGADHVDNMLPLDSSVNRSLGAQISAQLKSLGLKPGDVVCSITISARC
jgi:Pretoxin HINT domain